MFSSRRALRGLQLAVLTAGSAVLLAVPAPSVAVAQKPATQDGGDLTMQLYRARKDRTTTATAPAKTGGRQASAVCGSSTAPTVVQERSAHFMVDFTSDTPLGGLTRRDYIDALEATWSKMIDGYGWAAPPATRQNASKLYHVRVQDTEGANGFVDLGGTYAGRVGDNPSTPWVEDGAEASCMSLRNDFSRGWRTTEVAKNLMRTTVAHEFTHAIQYGLGRKAPRGGENEEAWVVLAESSAVAMQEDLVPEAREGYRWLSPNTADSVIPHAAFASNGPQWEEYRMWVVLRGLSERFGLGVPGGSEDVLQMFWESQGGGHGGARYLGALDAALARKGTTLAAAFHDFALADWFRRPCGEGWAQPHCSRDAIDHAARSAPRIAAGTVGAGQPYAGSVESNYAVQYVRVADAAGPSTLGVTVRPSGHAVRVTIACTAAGRLAIAGTATATAAGAGSIRFDPASCDPGTSVAIVTSASRTSDDPRVDTHIAYDLAQRSS